MTTSKTPNGMREDYFEFFNNNGVKYPALGNPCKPTIGDISPGCMTCIEGTWSCIYINNACTKHCFFCPSPQNDSSRQPVVPENISFASVQDYIKYLERFDFSGIAFSGGEPLLAIDSLLEYINEIKRTFGDRHYIWAYTNGDLATRQNLSLLKTAGLNELRFDIAANNYDLAAVEKAVGHMETVAVEIPAIPEDVESLKPIIIEMEKVGVKYLNLHQLMKTKHNSKHMTLRGYSPVNQDLYPDQTPILESELAAFELLKYAIEVKSTLGINYCSRGYKDKFQGMAHRKRAALFCKDKKVDQTKTGYLRRAAIDSPTEKSRLIENHVSDAMLEMAVAGEKNKLVFPVDKLNLLLTKDYQTVDIVYYEPVLGPAQSEATSDDSCEMFGKNKLCLQKNVKLHTTLDNITSAFLFYKLFVEKAKIEALTKELLDLYGLNQHNTRELMADITQFYDKFKGFEYLSDNLDPYD